MACPYNSATSLTRDLATSQIKMLTIRTMVGETMVVLTMVLTVDLREVMERVVKAVEKEVKAWCQVLIKCLTTARRRARGLQITLEVEVQADQDSAEAEAERDLVEHLRDQLMREP